MGMLTTKVWVLFHRIKQSNFILLVFGRLFVFVCLSTYFLIKKVFLALRQKNETGLHRKGETEIHRGL